MEKSDRTVFRVTSPMVDFLPSTEDINSLNPDIEDWIKSRIKKKLKKLGYETEIRLKHSIVVNEGVITSENIMKLIRETKFNLKKLFFTPHIVLMGHTQFEVLCNAQFDYGSVYESFNSPLNIAFHDEDGQKQTIYGIKIKVIPGLDTVVIVPEESLR